MRALATADGVVVVPTDAAIPGKTCDRDRGVVLLTAVQPVGVLIISADAVKLCGRLVVYSTPGFAAIKGYRRTPVVGINEVVSIERVEPEIVMITMRGADQFPVLACICLLYTSPSPRD